MTNTVTFCFTSEKARELYNGKPPQYETPFASGFDLRAVDVLNDTNTLDLIQLMQTGRILIKTGIRIAIPLIENQLTELQIRSRSGLALKHGVRVFQGIGTIDNDYRGELGVILENAGHEPFKINIGERIAQGVFNPLKQFDFQEVSQEDFEANFCDTKRGNGGFGSTGTN